MIGSVLMNSKGHHESGGSGRSGRLHADSPYLTDLTNLSYPTYLTDLTYQTYP